MAVINKNTATNSTTIKIEKVDTEQKQGYRLHKPDGSKSFFSVEKYGTMKKAKTAAETKAAELQTELDAAAAAAAKDNKKNNKNTGKDEAPQADAGSIEKVVEDDRKGYRVIFGSKKAFIDADEHGGNMRKTRTAAEEHLANLREKANNKNAGKTTPPAKETTAVEIDAGTIEKVVEDDRKGYRVTFNGKKFFINATNFEGNMKQTKAYAEEYLAGLREEADAKGKKNNKNAGKEGKETTGKEGKNKDKESNEGDSKTETLTVAPGLFRLTIKRTGRSMWKSKWKDADTGETPIRNFAIAKHGEEGAFLSAARELYEATGTIKITQPDNMPIDYKTLLKKLGAGKDEVFIK
jgi:hypothetical protein